MTTSALRPKLQIYTSSWSTELPPDVARIGVSRAPPRGQRGFRRMMELAPGPWYRTASELQYIAQYRAQLAALDPTKIADRLNLLAEGAPCVALLCFEQPEMRDTWCHRSLVAGWLADTLGLAVPEWGFEHLGAAEHPMLPPSLRKQRESEISAST